MGFIFEKLNAYQKALQFADEVRVLLTKPASGSGAIADQLRRASMSIPLNLAEGSGRWHPKEKKQFYWIARGSVNECIPLLRLAANQNMISGQDYARLCSSLEVIAKMLTKLIASVDVPPK